MADKFQIEVATPERLLFREEATTAQIPGKDGYLGVLPDHAPLLSELGIGALTFVDSNNTHHSMAVHGGFVEILDNHVRVLADEGEPAQEIDVTKAQEALRKAQEAMGNPAVAIDIASALTEALKAQARIDAASKLQKGED